MYAFQTMQIQFKEAISRAVAEKESVIEQLLQQLASVSSPVDDKTADDKYGELAAVRYVTLLFLVRVFGVLILCDIFFLSVGNSHFFKKCRK
jgi:hypothetical protein